MYSTRGEKMAETNKQKGGLNPLKGLKDSFLEIILFLLTAGLTNLLIAFTDNQETTARIYAIFIILIIFFGYFGYMILKKKSQYLESILNITSKNPT